MRISIKTAALLGFAAKHDKFMKAAIDQVLEREKARIRRRLAHGFARASLHYRLTATPKGSLYAHR